MSVLRWCMLTGLALPLAAWFCSAMAWAGGAEGKDEPLPDGAIKRLNVKPKGASDPAFGFYSLTFSPDGKTLAARCTDNTARFWEMPNGNKLENLRIGPSYENNLHGSFSRLLVYSPDGKTLATSPLSTRMFHAWNPNTHERRFQCDDEVLALAFSPDSAVLAVVTPYGIRVRSARDGKEIRLLNSLPKVKGKRPGEVDVAFSPDGRLLASGNFDFTIRLWDWGTGQEVGRIQLDEGAIRGLEFSPDGRMLASCRGAQGSGIHLRDMLTGVLVHRLDRLSEGRRHQIHSIAFSPDGHLLAAAEGPPDNIVRVWHAFTGRQVARFEPGKAVWCVAMSPDGKLLASGQVDGTVLLWDVARLARARPLVPSDKELEQWWAQLGGKDKAAWEAVWNLSQSEDKATVFLKDRLKPAADRDRVKRLIADLDADSFQAREAASRQLAQLGGLVERDLRQALAGDPSAEAKKRLEALLKGMTVFVSNPAELRQLRGIQVLEQIGTPEAKKLLQALAKGAPGARRTRDAQLALDRLNRRPPPSHGPADAGRDSP